MPITDLTGTRWLINSTTCTAGYGYFNIQGKAVLNTTPSFEFQLSELNIGFDVNEDAVANSVVAYASNLYRYEPILASYIVEITGGTSVTNQNLINWLLANATQVLVTDLTNTTWTINSLTCSAGYGQFSVDGSLKRRIEETDEYMTLNFEEFHIGYEGHLDSSFTPSETAAANSVCFVGDYIVPNAYFNINSNDIITFNSGIDAANRNLIVWLSQNATLSVLTYTITPTLTHITSSNTNYTIDENDIWTTTLTADAGYDLPSSVSVTNATVSSYNSTTGELTLFNPTGNVTLVATATEHVDPPTPTDNSIYFGNLPVAKILYGSTEVSKIYFGNTKVYDKDA